jgi:type IV fimbrial biogenesis protein FimT
VPLKCAVLLTDPITGLSVLPITVRTVTVDRLWQTYTDHVGKNSKKTANTLNILLPNARNYPHIAARVGGFTLIELLITISIVAVIAMIGIPAMGDFILNNRIRSQSGDLMLQLVHARSEAMRTASRVTICPGTSGSGCAGSAWESGWVAFIDTNTNAALDTGETIISVSAALDGNNTLRSATFSTYISFRHDGSSADISSAPQGGSFALCDSRGFGNDARAIVITVIGRIKVLEANATGSGISNCGT